MLLKSLGLRHVVFTTVGVVVVACGSDPTQPAPGPATQAAFDAQPAASVASSHSLGTVRVALLDAEGRVSRSDAPVTLALVSTDPSAQLGGTTVVNASNGVATFTDLSVARAGTGFRLEATATGINSAMSQTFDVTPGPATQLIIEQNGISASVYPRCVPDALPFTVWITDAAGNRVTTATPAVTLSLARTGAFGITLSTDESVYGTLTRSAVAGVAEFTDISVHKSGVYAITATAPGLGSATAAGYVGGCWMDRLVFLTQPTDGTAGVALPTFSVLRVDAYGNATSEQHSPGPSYSVTIALGQNPSGATLSGTLSEWGGGTSARDFTRVSVDKVGTDYTLVATTVTSITGTTLTVTSAPFSIH